MKWKKGMIVGVTILAIIGNDFWMLSGGYEIEAENIQVGGEVPFAVEEKEDKIEAADELTEEVPPEVRKETIDIISVGDIMMHSDQIESGRRGTSYDYNEMFNEIKPYLEAGDITIGNLEFTMSGADKGYTGYPEFNAPSEIADALKNAGFDVLTTANNHSLDRRFYGIEHTIDVLDNRGILHTGTYKTKEASEKILISRIKDTAIAFLSYTYGTNGIPTQQGKEFCVNYINEEKIKSDMNKARNQGAELICISIHFGDEYHIEPNERQEKLVDFLAENGADIILGGHPHVLEPMELRIVERNGQKKEVVIIYSQGNFISGQRERYTDTGAVFDIRVTKDFSSGEISLDEVAYMPTWVDVSRIDGRKQFRVLPVKKAIHLYESQGDSLISENDYEKLKRSLSDARKILDSSNEKIKEVWLRTVSFQGEYFNS